MKQKPLFFVAIGFGLGIAFMFGIGMGSALNNGHTGVIGFDEIVAEKITVRNRNEPDAYVSIGLIEATGIPEIELSDFRDPVDGKLVSLTTGLFVLPKTSFLASDVAVAQSLKMGHPNNQIRFEKQTDGSWTFGQYKGDEAASWLLNPDWLQFRSDGAVTKFNAHGIWLDSEGAPPSYTQWDKLISQDK